MLQTVIWGIAIMLVVKGLDVMHQESIAQRAKQGALLPAILACVVAFGGAIILVLLANGQVAMTGLSGLNTPSSSVWDSAGPTAPDAVADEAEKVADELEAAADNAAREQ